MQAAASVQPTVQAVLIVIGVIVALVAIYAYAAWLHARKLHRTREPIAQFWRGLEKALVEHHQAAEDLVSVADEAGVLTRADRERAEGAVAAATMTGTPAQRSRREMELHAAIGLVRERLARQGQDQSLRIREALATYRQAWGQVEIMGRRYSELAEAYNKMAKNPLFHALNKRSGRAHVESFTPPTQPGPAITVVGEL